MNSTKRRKKRSTKITEKTESDTIGQIKPKTKKFALPLAIPTEEELRREFSGKFIGVLNGQIIDQDTDVKALHNRLKLQYFDTPLGILHIKEDGQIITLSENELMRNTEFLTPEESHKQLVESQERFEKQMQDYYEEQEREYNERVGNDIYTELTEFINHLESDSEKIRTLPENWDGNGGQPYKRGTLEKMELFLIKMAIVFGKKFGKILPIPRILPGIKGDIDIEWVQEKFHLLLSISEKKELIGLYGKGKDGKEIQKDLDIQLINEEVLSWLNEQIS